MTLQNPAQSAAMPKRFPVGARYIIEGRYGKDGHFRVFSRYVVLPGGRRINVSANPGLAAFLPAPRVSRRANRTTASQAPKKILGAAGTRRQRQN